MGKALSEAQVEAYRRDGFVFPVRIMDRPAADTLRARFDALEAETGAELQSRFKIKAHMPLTWLNELVRNPAMLDAVEDLIGPDILCWGSSFFTKKAREPALRLLAPGLDLLRAAPRRDGDRLGGLHRQQDRIGLRPLPPRHPPERDFRS